MLCRIISLAFDLDAKGLKTEANLLIQALHQEVKPEALKKLVLDFRKVLDEMEDKIQQFGEAQDVDQATIDAKKKSRYWEKQKASPWKKLWLTVLDQLGL